MILRQCRVGGWLRLVFSQREHETQSKADAALASNLWLALDDVNCVQRAGLVSSNNT